MDIEHCIRGEDEENWNFLDRIERVVGKSWPDDLSGPERGQQAGGRAIKPCKEDNDIWILAY